MEKFKRKFKREKRKIKKFLNDRDFELLLKYFINLIKNNLRILKNPAIETTANARRSYVYSVDFGFTTGGVLRDRHYCVVLYSLWKTAIVVPLTSKNNTNIFNVELGIIQNLSRRNIVSYALVNQITTVSRAMLMQPRRNRNERVKLNSEQMNKLEQGLEKILFKNKIVYKYE